MLIPILSANCSCVSFVLLRSRTRFWLNCLRCFTESWRTVSAQFQETEKIGHDHLVRNLLAVIQAFNYMYVKPLTTSIGQITSPMKTLRYLFIGILSTSFIIAQEAAAPRRAAKEAPGHRRGINQSPILDELELRKGAGSTVFRRVVPPVVPVAPARVAAQTAVAAVEESAEPVKKSEVLLLSATVFERKVTELRWTVGGRQFRAWSNVDFNVFTGVTQVESEDTIFSVMLALDNQSAADAATSGELPKDFPAAGRFAKPAAYFVEQGVEAPAESLAGLDALHVYFGTHREQLFAAAAKRATQQEQSPPNAAQPAGRTVIEFWPKKSRNYPTK